LQEKRENNMKWMNESQTIWNYVRPIFHNFTSPFRGLTIDKNTKLKDSETIVEVLADHYEKHFTSPEYNRLNFAHSQSIGDYEMIGKTTELFFGNDQIRGGC
jgi:hypothetical protein